MGLTLRVPSLWDLLGDLRSQVDAELAAFDPDLRQCAVMVASELTENALKYGRAGPGDEQASLVVDHSSERIAIVVSSLVRATREADVVISTVNEIRASADPMALYHQQLRRLMLDAEAGKSARVGLYRIAGEGGFGLSAALRQGRLTVEASRENAR